MDACASTVSYSLFSMARFSVFSLTNYACGHQAGGRQHWAAHEYHEFREVGGPAVALKDHVSSNGKERNDQ